MSERPIKWQSGGSLTLEEAAVHVWRIAADTHFGDINRLHALLTPEEQARAARFHSPVDQARWVVGRALLRKVLGGYLMVDAVALRFDYGPHGKPLIRAEQNPLGVCFNVSHAGNFVLYAVGMKTVGVDVEKIRHDVDVLSLAQHWFSDRECRVLDELPSSLKAEAFYAAWTRKEAYFKARGYGLAKGVDHVEVSVHPHNPAALVAAADDPIAPSRWSLRDLTLKSGYRAALAMEGRGTKTRLWEYVGSRSGT